MFISWIEQRTPLKMRIAQKNIYTFCGRCKWSRLLWFMCRLWVPCGKWFTLRVCAAIICTSPIFLIFSSVFPLCHCDGSVESRTEKKSEPDFNGCRNSVFSTNALASRIIWLVSSVILRCSSWIFFCSLLGHSSWSLCVRNRKTCKPTLKCVRFFAIDSRASGEEGEQKKVRSMARAPKNVATML